MHQGQRIPDCLSPNHLVPRDGTVATIGEGGGDGGRGLTRHLNGAQLDIQTSHVLYIFIDALKTGSLLCTESLPFVCTYAQIYETNPQVPVPYSGLNLYQQNRDKQ